MQSTDASLEISYFAFHIRFVPIVILEAQFAFVSFNLNSDQIIITEFLSLELKQGEENVYFHRYQLVNEDDNLQLIKILYLLEFPE